MNIEDLLKLLNEHRVEYAIIGANACAAHGYVRATEDIDILINPSEENIKRLRPALEKFGYDTTDASLEDFQTKKVLLRKYWLDTDIHPYAKGIETIAALKDKVPGEYEDVPTYFVSLNDLIEMKKAAGRPKDLEDLKFLKKIRETTQK
jgi:hypothetical protein